MSGTYDLIATIGPLFVGWLGAVGLVIAWGLVAWLINRKRRAPAETPTADTRE